MKLDSSKKPHLSLFSFFLFRHYFLSSKSISLIRVVSLICLAGLALSVFSLILVMSVMGGFRQSIQNRLLNKESHLVLHFKEDFSVLQKNPLHSLPQNLKEGVQKQIPFETQEFILKTKDHFMGVVAKGYSAQKLAEDISLHSMQIMGKESLESMNQKISQDSILITSHLASHLNLFEGDEVTLLPTLSLLLPPSEAPPTQTMKIHSVLDINSQKEERMSFLYRKGEIVFKDFSQIQQGLELQLKDPQTYPLYMKHLKNYGVQNWVQRNSSLFFALKLEKIVMFLLIVIALMISFLGISSDLFLLITQKQKDIGILQAIGLSPKEMTHIFTLLGFFLSSVGIFLGLFLGILISVFLKYNHFPFLPEIYQDRTLPTAIDPLIDLGIALGTLLLAWIFCYLPARYLSHKTISEFLTSPGR